MARRSDPPGGANRGEIMTRRTSRRCRRRALRALALVLASASASVLALGQGSQRSTPLRHAGIGDHNRNDHSPKPLGVLGSRSLRIGAGALAMISAVMTDKSLAAAKKRKAGSDDEDDDGGSEESDFQPKKEKKKAPGKARAASTKKPEPSRARGEAPAKPTAAKAAKPTLKPSSAFGIGTLPHKKVLAWAKKSYLDQRIIDVIKADQLDGVGFLSIDRTGWIANGVTPAPIRKMEEAKEKLQEQLRTEARRTGGATAEYVDRVQQIATSTIPVLRVMQLQNVCIELELDLGGNDELTMIRNIREFIRKHDSSAADFEYPPEAELIREEEEELQQIRENAPVQEDDSEDIERLLKAANKFTGYDPPADAKRLPAPEVIRDRRFSVSGVDLPRDGEGEGGLLVNQKDFEEYDKMDDPFGLGKLLPGGTGGGKRLVAVPQALEWDAADVKSWAEDALDSATVGALEDAAFSGKELMLCAGGGAEARRLLSTVKRMAAGKVREAANTLRRQFQIAMRSKSDYIDLLKAALKVRDEGPRRKAVEALAADLNLDAAEDAEGLEGLARRIKEEISGRDKMSAFPPSSEVKKAKGFLSLVDDGDEPLQKIQSPDLEVNQEGDDESEE